MPRRTKAAIDTDRKGRWAHLAIYGWSLNTACTKCGHVLLCRGTRRASVRCEDCFK